MTYMQWSEAYSVGVDEIDEQHRKLFDMINCFHQYMEEKDASGPKQLLVNLFEYALEHFRTEEQYFEKFRYPGAESHKKQHQEFETSVAEFQKAYQARGVFNVPLVSMFLKEWVICHVLISDRNYVGFFRENGLA